MGSEYYDDGADSSHNSDMNAMDEAIGFGEGGNDALGDIDVDMSFGSSSGREEITTHRNDDGTYTDVQMGSIEVSRGEDGRFEESEDDDGGFLSGFLG